MSDAGDHRDIPSIIRSQRRYDHRLRTLVQTTGDLDLEIPHGVPRSTARGWLTQTSAAVVTLDVLELDTVQLQQEVMALRRRIARLVSWLRLVFMVLEVSGISLSQLRLLEGSGWSQREWDGAGQAQRFVRRKMDSVTAWHLAQYIAARPIRS